MLTRKITTHDSNDDKPFEDGPIKGLDVFTRLANRTIGEASARAVGVSPALSLFPYYLMY